MTQDIVYVGQELDLFAQATRWKKYWSDRLRPYLGAEVLEVGAGLGVNTPLLYSPAQSRWMCLEPDPDLAARLRQNCQAISDHERITVQSGIVADLPAEALFDTVLYIDVLEHIEDDAGELARAAEHLRPGGRIIVLSPAHMFLYSPFDRSIGHFRRYSKATLRAAGRSPLALERLLMLDSAGMLASLANRLLLRQSLPTLEQIAFWNNYLIPISLVIDPVIGYSVGKTIIGIWQKAAAE